MHLLCNGKMYRPYCRSFWEDRVWQYLSAVLCIFSNHPVLETTLYSKVAFLELKPLIQSLLFRNPQTALQIDQNLDLFKLNGECVIKRLESLPSEAGDRGFLLLSSDRVLTELVCWSNKDVMDVTFKVMLWNLITNNYSLCPLCLSICFIIFFTALAKCKLVCYKLF